ncbi:helix-turn-helix transcriptional regulator [Pseudomonas sp. NA-150]|uniref:helix-turn-helix transcriptional regulator n=1 Tax=Pseudomonas sp. NA-150 TaxID=3367525 RepID=UPI0037C561A6
MGRIETANSELEQLVEQIVASVTEHSGDKAIGDTLRWLRRHCRCKRALFYQFKGPILVTCTSSNVDPLWCDFYRQGRMLMDDPIIRSYRDKLGFLDWNEAFARHPPTPTFKHMVEEFDLLPGASYAYSHYVGPQQGVISVCSLGGMNRRLNSKDRYLLSHLVPVLHMAGKGRKFTNPTLTDKELEILKWACAGKTAWEIGIIREISEATVKFHLKSIYAKLGVANRAQAVGEALLQGLIG